MTDAFKVVLIVGFVLGACLVAVGMILGLTQSHRNRKRAALIELGRGAARKAEWRELESSKGSGRNGDDLASERNAAADAAFVLATGLEASLRRRNLGEEAIAAAEATYRSSRRDMLWIGAGTFVTAGISVLSVCAAPGL